MLLGYTLIATDAKKTMYGDNFENVSGIADPCLRYKCIYEIGILPENFKLPKNSKSDFFVTYEGFLLVSENVRKFCKQNKYEKIEFIPIPKQAGYYWMKPGNIIEFDFIARETKFLYYNKKCDGYKEIVGATPVCLKSKSPLKDGFFRTDLSFGGNGGREAKSPEICIGVTTYEKMKKSDLRGIYFEKILDSYKWQKKA